MWPVFFYLHDSPGVVGVVKKKAFFLPLLLSKCVKPSFFSFSFLQEIAFFVLPATILVSDGMNR